MDRFLAVLVGAAAPSAGPWLAVVTAIPEPSSVAPLVVGSAVSGLVRRRRTTV